MYLGFVRFGKIVKTKMVFNLFSLGLFSFIMLLPIMNVARSKLCDHLDYVVVNASLKKSDGSSLGRVIIHFSEVNKLLSEGISIIGSTDNVSSELIVGHIQESLGILKMTSTKNIINPKYTLGYVTKKLFSCYAEKDTHKPKFFLTSKFMSEVDQHQSEGLISKCDFFQYTNMSSLPLLPKNLIRSSHQRSSNSIRVYQTIGAFTGGTTAMRTLANTLHDLGFPVILCNDTNIASSECNAPKDSDLVVTGEWCEPVLFEYLKYMNYEGDVHLEVASLEDIFQPRKFLGRGIQYYLGFHHGRDECRGWITAADSQFIYTTLVHRGMHAYYLGCVMSEKITNAMQEVYSHSTETCDDVIKEKLILVDADFFDNYSPNLPVQFEIPNGYSFIVLRGFSEKAVVHLLQRAQIVLDLAMPGPERISSEAILFGCIPIIAERWNGASNIDFPGVLRVDAMNGTAITNMLQYVVDNYDSILESSSVDRQTTISDEISQPQFDYHRFWRYITSMWARAEYTVDAYFSSMYLHFVIDTTQELSIPSTSLERETTALFQVLAILYIYPLASIDIIVSDFLWFHRHHYVFIDYLRQSGYLQVDPMDPREFHLLNTTLPKNSFVHIRTAYPKSESVPSLQQIAKVEIPDRPWDAFQIFLPIGAVFYDPADLYGLIQRHIRERDTILSVRVNLKANAGAKITSLLLAGPEYISGSIFYDEQIQKIAHVNDLRVSLHNVLDLLFDDNAHRQNSMEIVRGAKETVFWQMLSTTYKHQLRRTFLKQQ